MRPTLLDHRFSCGPTAQASLLGSYVSQCRSSLSSIDCLALPKLQKLARDQELGVVRIEEE